MGLYAVTHAQWDAQQPPPLIYLFIFFLMLF